MNSSNNKRAHAVVVDEGLTEEISGLLVGLPEDVDCDNLAESVETGSAQIALIASRRPHRFQVQVGFGRAEKKMNIDLQWIGPRYLTICLEKRHITRANVARANYVATSS